MYINSINQNLERLICTCMWLRYGQSALDNNSQKLEHSKYLQIALMHTNITAQLQADDKSRMANTEVNDHERHCCEKRTGKTNACWLVCVFKYALAIVTRLFNTYEKL